MNYSKNKIWSNVWVCLAFCFFLFLCYPSYSFYNEEKERVKIDEGARGP
ncbi:hypothetical protein DZB91_04150 [Brevibacillus sp. VP]|nr:hypothetical protein DZB91_04150 [Brevibacillus sp. VP]